MNRSRLILLVTVLLVLGAGLVLGRVSARIGDPVAPPPASTNKPHSWLADQLELNSDQRQKMDAVWAETRQRMDESFDKRRALDRDREQAMVALLDEQQREAYDEILAEHRIARADLDKQRETIIRGANERSRLLLSDTQKQRWDTLTKEHPWHGGHGPGGRATSGPSTRPGDGGLGGPFSADFNAPPPLHGFESTNAHEAGRADASPVNPARPAATGPQ